jgi:hypothetical protein
MKCPHCTVNFHANWQFRCLSRNDNDINWSYATAHCPACDKIIIDFATSAWSSSINDYRYGSWRQLVPEGSSRGPVPKEVPPAIRQDYEEAANVLPISAKASAALSRRCLQNTLRANGYVAKDLAQEIDLLLKEPDPAKGIPATLRVSIDGIRNFGNFSAHPITDVTTLQIIDVEPHEAEWCLDILDEVFQHFYVRPAEAAAKKAALDAKLQAAGKPPSKS